MLSAVALVAATALLSALATGRVLRYARHALLDIPNERSSHSTPTPRGGGLGIVVAFLAALVLAFLLGWVPARIVAAVGGGAVLVAGTGWLDDHFNVPQRARFGVHVLAALWLVVAIGGVPILTLGPISLSLGWFGQSLVALAVVWLINLYNFMDGIDALAAGQAITAGLIGGAILGIAGQPILSLLALLLAAATSGFLPWNLPPARIFMGDVGSGFLGFLFAALAVLSENAGVPALLWTLLLAPFLFDATVTLLRRMLRRERWFEAHRSHAYQRAVQSGYSHGQVSLTIVGLAMFTGALALVVLLAPPALLPALAIATLILGLFYWHVQRSHDLHPRGE